MSESSVMSEALGSIPMSPERADMGEGAEKQVIRAAQRGSADAVEELVRRHWPDAYATALGLLCDEKAAEDVAQDGVLAAIRALDRFDRRRPFRPWLQRIVANRALDLLRAKGRRPELLIGEEPRPEVGVEPTSSGLSDELLDALRGLAPRERAIVVLRHLAGFDSREIGEIVEMSPSAVRSALSRSLARLRVELVGEEGSATPAGDSQGGGGA